MFGEFDRHVVFKRCKIFDDVQVGSNNRVGKHMFFSRMHYTEKISDSYFS